MTDLSVKNVMAGQCIVLEFAVRVTFSGIQHIRDNSQLLLDISNNQLLRASQGEGSSRDMTSENGHGIAEQHG